MAVPCTETFRLSSHLEIRNQDTAEGHRVGPVNSYGIITIALDREPFH